MSNEGNEKNEKEESITVVAKFTKAIKYKVTKDQFETMYSYSRGRDLKFSLESIEIIDRKFFQEEFDEFMTGYETVSEEIEFKEEKEEEP